MSNGLDQKNEVFKCINVQVRRLPEGESSALAGQMNSYHMFVDQRHKLLAARDSILTFGVCFYSAQQLISKDGLGYCWLPALLNSLQHKPGTDFTD